MAVNIDRPGLYAVDMQNQFGWKGVGEVETCLYANGEEEEITYEYVKYAAKPSDEPVDAHDTVRFAMDDGRLDEACLLSATTWGWSLAAHNRKQRLTRLQAFELNAGEHVLKLAPRDSIYVDMIAVTDNPAMFD